MPRAMLVVLAVVLSAHGAQAELHDEWLEAGGAHVLVGRKFSNAGANGSG
jgi:hypothetical protein